MLLSSSARSIVDHSRDEGNDSRDVREKHLLQIVEDFAIQLRNCRQVEGLQGLLVLIYPREVSLRELEGASDFIEDLRQILNQLGLGGLLAPEVRHLRAEMTQDTHMHDGEADALDHLVDLAHATSLCALLFIEVMKGIVSKYSAILLYILFLHLEVDEGAP